MALLSGAPASALANGGTVQLANRLGLRVVAEGVEDEATAEAITAMGADLIQGYLISRPLMAGTLDAWRETRDLEAAVKLPASPTLSP